jgi:ATP-dependent DNA helicase MPH1
MTDTSSVPRSTHATAQAFTCSLEPQLFSLTRLHPHTDSVLINSLCVGAMSWSDDEFGFVDDEALLLAASQSDPPQSDGQPSPASDRPLKKRKLNSEENSHAGLRNNEASSNSYSDEDDSFGPPLPPNRRKSSSTDTSLERQESGQQNPARHKRRMIIPKDSEIPPDEFVTQLTQPHSSPSRIRGPRWKKIAPPPTRAEVQPQDFDPMWRPPNFKRERPIPAPTNLKTNTNTRESHSGFAEQSLFVSQDSIGESGQPVRTGHAPPADSFAIDLDDFPSNAFDSSPLSSPKASRSTSNRAVSDAGSTQTNGQPKNFRQTTLFGDTAQQAEPSIQSRHNWPLASKKEAPTHHKLNGEALRTWVYPMNIGASRDYQFNIVSRGLFHNLLVALPTGLGKTFIAATIMLNWFRWTKDAQIVFVAPTKPLVSQQVEACFQTVGIPRSQTSMLTGGVSPGIRSEEWQSKRVFFMTPQTLINDLKTGICDPKRMVLLVVDEAHRATGGYAYVEVVKFLRRFNTSFRILALTATPGSTVEAVQEVIDGLDIARTEIRTEESLDIRAYTHKKIIELHLFDYSEEMETIMDLCSKAIKPVLNQLNAQNAYWAKDPMMLTAFGLTKARAQWSASNAGRNAHWGVKGPVLAIFSTLASIAHSIELLQYHGMGPFYRNMVALCNDVSTGDKGDKYKKQILNNEHFKKMMTRLSAWTSDPEFIGHPKLEYVKSIILNHFMDAGEGRGAADGRPPSATRIMVFCQYRDSAEEVVRVLKRHEPMIRPHIFNGQAASKGTEGMDQKSQLATIEAFKKGKYNTLVSTSIGEEGLDIGEIDLILLYDSSPSPIRMLQRIGRTGRKRAGNVHLLLMRGKEEESYAKSKDNHEKMQKMISEGDRFTYHDDRSPRILPKEVQPVVDKRVVEIPVENSQLELPEPKRRGRPPKAPPKKFHMPDNVITGFVKASRINKQRDDSQSERDEDPDEELPQRWERKRSPSPEAMEMPPLEDVLLTPAQEKELIRKYADLHDAPSQLIEPPRFDGYPDLARALQPTKYVKHGRFTTDWVKTFKKIHETSTDCLESLQRNLHMEDLVGDQIENSDDDSRPRSRGVDRAIGPRNSSCTSKAKKSTPKNLVLVLSQRSGIDSSATVTQESPVKGVEPPFYVSQKSQDGEDEDLPDLDALLNTNKGIGSGKDDVTVSVGRKIRAKRFVVDDDDSDD